MKKIFILFSFLLIIIIYGCGREEAVTEIEESPGKIMEQFLTKGFELVPVMENKELVGVIEASELQKFYELSRLKKLMK